MPTSFSSPVYFIYFHICPYLSLQKRDARILLCISVDRAASRSQAHLRSQESPHYCPTATTGPPPPPPLLTARPRRHQRCRHQPRRRVAGAWVFCPRDLHCCHCPHCAKTSMRALAHCPIFMRSNLQPSSWRSSPLAPLRPAPYAAAASDLIASAQSALARHLRAALRATRVAMCSSAHRPSSSCRRFWRL